MVIIFKLHSFLLYGQSILLPAPKSSFIESGQHKSFAVCLCDSLGLFVFTYRSFIKIFVLTRRGKEFTPEFSVLAVLKIRNFFRLRVVG